MNHVPMNILVKVFVWTHVFVSLIICLGLEFLGSLLTAFKLLRTFQSFSKQLYNFTLLSAMDKGSIFSTFSSALDTLCIFDSSHASRCGVVSHRGFDLHISDGPCKEYYTVKIN